MDTSDDFGWLILVGIVFVLYVFMRWVAWDFKRDLRSRRLNKANTGDAQSLYDLGMDAYYKGRSARQRQSAVEFFRRASDAGHTDALAMLGECYANGVGVEKNVSRALQYWKQAAERSSLQAMGYLIDYYAEGEAEDSALMAHYCHSAARLGDLDACWKLGLCFLHGDGVAQNRKQALKWLRYAAERRHIGAARLLREMGISFCGDTYYDDDEV